MSRRTLLILSANFLPALTIGAGYLASGWLTRAAVLFGSLALVGGISVLADGIRRSQAIMPLKRLGAGGSWAALWCVGLFLPFVVRWGTLRAEVVRLPVPKDARAMEFTIDPVAYDRQPDFMVLMMVPQTYREVHEFYRTEFARRGWSYREPERHGVSFGIPEESYFDGCCETLLVHEPTEPILSTDAEGLMIFRRGSRVLAVQVLPPSLYDWNGTPASVRIYPFERRPPFSR